MNIEMDVGEKIEKLSEYCDRKSHLTRLQKIWLYDDVNGLKDSKYHSFAINSCYKSYGYDLAKLRIEIVVGYIGLTELSGKIINDYNNLVSKNQEKTDINSLEQMDFRLTICNNISLRLLKSRAILDKVMNLLLLSYIGKSASDSFLQGNKSQKNEAGKKSNQRLFKKLAEENSLPDRLVGFIDELCDGINSKRTQEAHGVSSLWRFVLELDVDGGESNTVLDILAFHNPLNRLIYHYFPAQIKDQKLPYSEN